MSDAIKLPAYPVWEATGMDAAFGAKLQHYVPRQDADGITKVLRRERDIASSLFFSGGRLSDHGVKWRADVDGKKAMLCLRALLCSFEPSHEQKEATAALALHHWTEAA